MKNIYSIPVLQLNQPSKYNDAIFPTEIVQRSIMKLYDDLGTMNCLIGVWNFDKSIKCNNIPITQASHLVTSLFIENNWVYAHLVLLDTKSGKLLQKEHNKGDIRFVLMGIGDINTDYIVQDYEIYTVTAHLTENKI